MFRMSQRSHYGRGFTLIELVVVITILGILAAFAVPRFVAMQAQARATSVDSLRGALWSASAMTHSMWMVSGNPSTIAVEGATITMTNGYPSYADIDNTLVDTTGFTYDPLTGVFAKVGAANPARCTVIYTPPAAVGQGPTIIYDNSDCT